MKKKPFNDSQNSFVHSFLTRATLTLEVRLLSGHKFVALGNVFVGEDGVTLRRFAETSYRTDEEIVAPNGLVVMRSAVHAERDGFGFMGGINVFDGQLRIASIAVL